MKSVLFASGVTGTRSQDSPRAIHQCSVEGKSAMTETQQETQTVYYLHPYLLDSNHYKLLKWVWVDGCVCVWMSGCRDGCVDVWMGVRRCVDGWMVG